MEEMITIHNLNKTFGKKQVLQNVSFNLYSGKIVGLLGPNGSGKTTILKILNGLLKDYTGDIFIDKRSIGVHSKQIISYLPDEPYFESWMKVSDALHLFNDMYEDFNLDKALSLMDQMNIEKDVKIKSLSKGMTEKLQLILVMSREAKIYLLDEPLGGVDPVARDMILDMILDNCAEDSLVVISTHLIRDIEKIFDEVIFIKEGTIVLHEDCEELRMNRQASIDEIFKEVMTC